MRPQIFFVALSFFLLSLDTDAQSSAPATKELLAVEEKKAENAEADLSGPIRLFISRQVESVTKSIESASAVSITRDYLFPAFSAFFSAMLGWLVAHYTHRHQMQLQINQQRILVANRWIMNAESVYSALITIKGNYYDRLAAAPDGFKRSLSVPFIHGNFRPISDSDYSALSFLVPVANDEKSRNYTDGEHKWTQIPRLAILFENYNLLLTLWEKRNGLRESIDEILFSRGLNVTELNDHQFLELVTPRKSMEFVMITENVVSLTDSLLLEVQDLFMHFPSAVRKTIPKRQLQALGGVLGISIPDSVIQAGLLNKVPGADIAFIQRVHAGGITAEQVRRWLDTGYA